MRRSRAAAVMFWLVVVFLWAPIVVLVLYSFNESRFSAVWTGFTFDWYARLFGSAETAAALRNTFIVSVTSTIIATSCSNETVGSHLSTRLALDASPIR